MRNAIQLALLLVIVASSANVNAQVYKCVGTSGKIEIQQAPCRGTGEKINVRPASGHAPAPAPTQANNPESAPSEPAATVQSNRYAKAADAMQAERLRKEGWYAMNDKKTSLDNTIAQCQSEQRQIEAEKDSSRNNLAGATRDVSISNKMQAAAAICDGKIRRAEKDVETAAALCEKIKCIASY